MQPLVGKVVLILGAVIALWNPGPWSLLFGGMLMGSGLTILLQEITRCCRRRRE